MEADDTVADRERMKILHMVHGYTPAHGGTEHLIQLVSEQLVRDFHDSVTVATLNTRSIEAFIGRRSDLLPTGTSWIHGVRVLRCPVITWPARPLYWLQGGAFVLKLPGNDWLRTFYNGPISPVLYRVACAEPADLIAASSFPLLHMQYAMWAGKRRHCPVVLHGGLHPEDRWGFDRPLIYKTIGAVQHYIANTTYERDIVVKHGVDASRVTVIGPGTDPDRFSRGDGDAVRMRYRLSAAPIIGFIGQQASHKGIDTLVNAMPLVWQEHPEAQLLIAGARTGFSPRLDRLIDELKDRGGRVTVVPNFPEEEKADLFAACDIFAYPSGYESFGIAFLEAWACRKPVVGCRSGAVPSVVTDGHDGLLVPYRNPSALAGSLLRLLDDASLRRDFGEHGYRKVLELHTWPSVTAAYRKVYERALDGYGRKL